MLDLSISAAHRRKLLCNLAEQRFGPTVTSTPPVLLRSSTVDLQAVWLGESGGLLTGVLGGGDPRWLSHCAVCRGVDGERLQ